MNLRRMLAQGLGTILLTTTIGCSSDSSPTAPPMPPSNPTRISCILNLPEVNVESNYLVNNGRDNAYADQGNQVAAQHGQYGVRNIHVQTGNWYVQQDGNEPELRREITWTIEATDEGIGYIGNYLGSAGFDRQTHQTSAVDKLFYRPERATIDGNMAVALGANSTHPFVQNRISEVRFVLNNTAFDSFTSTYFSKGNLILPLCK